MSAPIHLPLKPDPPLEEMSLEEFKLYTLETLQVLIFAIWNVSLSLQQVCQVHTAAFLHPSRMARDFDANFRLFTRLITDFKNTLK